jgi:hypothetical protein
VNYGLVGFNSCNKFEKSPIHPLLGILILSIGQQLGARSTFYVIAFITVILARAPPITMLLEIDSTSYLQIVSSASETFHVIIFLFKICVP